MTDQAKPIPCPRQRYLRFSVRKTIVLVLVIGACLGWIARSARIQREYVAAIRNAGGAVAYGSEEEEFSHPVDGPWWAPGWLVALVGTDFFGHITAVGLTLFSNLDVLNLKNTEVSDAGLTHLKGLSKLTTLCLERTQVTDAGAKELMRAMPTLTISR